MDRDSPRPSWYEPLVSGLPNDWPITCRSCDAYYRTTGAPFRCACGHTITAWEAQRALNSLREDRV